MKQNLLFLVPIAMLQTEAATIEVEPETTRSIEGISELDRQKYISICDPGTGFDQRMKDGEGVYDELVQELGISFGRQLGVVKQVARSLPEDPTRPEHADLGKLKKSKPQPPSDRMLADFGPNLNVAAHGSPNAYPEYMGRYHVAQAEHHGKPEYLPRNIDAAAELAAAVLKHTYSDFDRPAFFEPVNEPHWIYFRDPHFAEWHLKTMKAVHRSTPGVKVGGPCLSVCYFYRGNYQSWTGLKGFIDTTQAQMDFYSFHAYDYFRWEEDEYLGRIQTGLPLEGVLDLVQNYTVNTYGKDVDIVVSEQGGYNGFPKGGEYDGEEQAIVLANRFFPGDTFEHEMMKRSIVNSLMMGSLIANTLTFMEHPHTVQKAVPFLLPKTWSWGPKYYAQLYVPYDYNDETRWVPTHLIDFFKFFRGLEGRRVKTLCDDPDLQARAFVKGRRLFLAINNQSYRPESVSLSGINTPTVTLRRMGRNPDFTGFYREETIDTPESMTLGSREAVMLVADYDRPIMERRAVNEKNCYGDKVTVPIEDATFTIKVPVDQAIDYAVLRVGLTRDTGLSYSPDITLNGKTLSVPLEDCVDRLEYGEYASTKLVPLDVADLKATNRVTVSFPDSDVGAVGSAVIRIAVAGD